MSIAQNIRYLRKKQGWGQDTLAEKLDYKSYTTIQKWESGVSEPPLKMVHALAELFHVDINDLVGTDLELADRMDANFKKETPSATKELSDLDSQIMDLVKGLSEEHKRSMLAELRGLTEGSLPLSS